MRIIGFSIKKILVERKNPIKDKLEIKSNINIDDITEETNKLSDKPTLKFDFSFSVDYNPNVAQIEIKGSILALDEKDEAKEILKDWKKKKFNNSPLKIGIFNFIMDKCNIKSMQLEDELGLPIHVSLPKLAPKPTDTTSAGKEGPKYTG